MTTDGPDGCDPCKCVPPGIGSVIQTYRYWVVKILCQILAASGGGSGSPATLEPEVKVLFGAVQAAYTSIGFDSGLKEFYVNNTTDTDIEFEFGASTSNVVHMTIPSGASRVISFNPLVADGPIYMRYNITTGAPTIGAVFVNGYL